MSTTQLHPNHTSLNRVAAALCQYLAAIEELIALQQEGYRIPPVCLQQIREAQYDIDQVLNNARIAKSLIHLTSEQGRAP